MKIIGISIVILWCTPLLIIAQNIEFNNKLINEQTKCDSIVFNSKYFLDVKYDSITWKEILNKPNYKDSTFYFTSHGVIGNSISLFEIYLFSKTKAAVFICSHHTRFEVVQEYYFINDEMVKYKDGDSYIDKNNEKFHDSEKKIKQNIDNILADTCIKTKRVDLNENCRPCMDIKYCNQTNIRRIVLYNNENTNSTAIYSFNNNKLSNIKIYHKNLNQKSISKTEEFFFENETMTMWTINDKRVDEKSQDFFEMENLILNKFNEILLIAKNNIK